VPPFGGVLKDGAVWGRGTADDKGALVQALLAMRALKETRAPLTHTVRLLVGSDEESGAKDITTYLKDHAPPDYSLVLDALFPVVVREKAWNALRLSVDDAPAGPLTPWHVAVLEAGLSPGIVPDRARLVLRWAGGKRDWIPLRTTLAGRRPAPGTHLEIAEAGAELVLTMKGRSAHSGVNIEGGRNALVSLANVVADALPPGGAGDLLRFVQKAGVDLRGKGLELPPPDPQWRGYDVTPAVVSRIEGRLTLTINIRRPLPWKGADLAKHLADVVDRWNREKGTKLVVDPKFFYDDEPYAVDPASPLVQRLLGAYRRVTGDKEAAPTVMGGGTYAKRIPQAVVFGPWFTDKPYPGHDVDEHMPVEDLRRGAHVLIEALVDLACGERLGTPLSVVSGQ
jgi:acetylornithine deacetylase/succinyl-diaminopimelate desuccinylase-like protein